MRVPGRLFTSDLLLREMDETVFTQLSQVAALPGIVEASLAMPDAHAGYGFPIGGVAAFNPDEGVVSAGGVGFDIACGVRTLLTSLEEDEVRSRAGETADALFLSVPAGMGKSSRFRLGRKELTAMLRGGAKWAVDQGYGVPADLERIEERGRQEGARPEEVSETALSRQTDQMGTLGSGNHYLEVQAVREIYDQDAARAFGLVRGRCVISIHCGSRGLGHQIGTDFMARMQQEGARQKIAFPDKELVYATISSPTGQAYLGAMRAGINCALANRQMITHVVRTALEGLFPGIRLPLLFDVSHNTCKAEHHVFGSGGRGTVYVHRKGATRALGPGQGSLPGEFRKIGQPVIVGGSMGTSSYILAGCSGNDRKSFSSACHGAGRSLSRTQAKKMWKGKGVLQALRNQGIIVRGHSLAGLAEEAPGAYKSVEQVIEVTHQAGLARRVARLEPLVCVKG